MSGITLAIAEAKLTEWLAADTAVASGQSVQVAGKTLTRANSKEIRDNIKYWNEWVVSLSGDASRSILVTPVIY
jgi:hypothetical protein